MSSTNAVRWQLLAIFLELILCFVVGNGMAINQQQNQKDSLKQDYRMVGKWQNTLYDYKYDVAFDLQSVSHAENPWDVLHVIGTDTLLKGSFSCPVPNWTPCWVFAKYDVDSGDIYYSNVPFFEEPVTFTANSRSHDSDDIVMLVPHGVELVDPMASIVVHFVGPSPTNTTFTSTRVCTFDPQHQIFYYVYLSDDGQSAPTTLSIVRMSIASSHYKLIDIELPVDPSAIHQLHYLTSSSQLLALATVHNSTSHQEGFFVLEIDLKAGNSTVVSQLQVPQNFTCSTQPGGFGWTDSNVIGMCLSASPAYPSPLLRSFPRVPKQYPSSSSAPPKLPERLLSHMNDNNNHRNHEGKRWIKLDEKRDTAHRERSVANYYHQEESHIGLFDGSTGKLLQLVQVNYPCESLFIE